MLEDAPLKQNHSRWLINHEASLQPHEKFHWVIYSYMNQAKHMKIPKQSVYILLKQNNI